MRRSLRDRFDPRRALVITSSPRSGSTLLGQAVSAIDRSCLLFEPLHRDRVPATRDAGIGWRPWAAPGAEWPEGDRLFREIFSGNVVNEWTARETTVRRARHAEHLVVKFVRANRCLPWLASRFGLRSPVLLVRHPCAVVASQARYGWSIPSRLRAPPWLADFPGLGNVFDDLGSPEEIRAGIWALDLLPAFLAPLPHPWLVITYEELLHDPHATLTSITDAWCVNADMDEAVSLLRGPSSTVASTGVSGLDGWRSQMDDAAAERVLDTVRSLGLTFYDHDVMPHRERMEPTALRHAIEQAALP